ncbi:MAG TPA: cytochrome c oxidase subunit I [Actinomycetota bacterium]|jgi:cytochrome c oxidase subunit I|nr:cytochrome c oxidase subunit I [Actinomycetota bacterium]
MASVSVPAERPKGLLRRPTATSGFWAWFTTVDHKKIGILYGITAFAFFLIGGTEALFIRLQLARPDQDILSPAVYNEIFTMHGVTMVFLVVMPLSAAFFNYLLPLMIGARDVAFPRLNAFSYWAFLFGGLFIYSSWFLGGAPNGGWFGYAPNSVTDPTIGMTFYAIGLLITGIASTVSAFNLAVTIINMRAPGMTLFRMPVFVWMGLVVQLLLAFSLPVITIGLVELLFDRLFGTHFFDPATGGNPVLWQHLFWLFGHPEVYILVLPAMGIVSEILPVFSRKPLFGYQFVVFSGVAIGFIGFGVWAHHMFAVGLGPVANTAFGVSTMIIAIPTGVKIFNWMGTMWNGDLRFTTPMLFAIGFIAMFVIGGLSGVTHAIVPSDYQQTDTYYIVAHFHYVLFGGAILGLFGGMYYWWPKVFGRMLSEGTGKVVFWMMLIGFNLTFGPMHVLGLQGMPRRIQSYPDSLGLSFWNLVSTIGAFTIAVSVLIFVVSAIASFRKPKEMENDPWDARTIEWLTTSPPPDHNFDEIPIVHSLDELWHRKYAETEGGRVVPVAAGGSGEPAHGPADAGEHDAAGHDGGHAIHLPGPSYYPVIAALGLPVLGYGLIFGVGYVIAGFVITLAGLFGWILEPSAE